MPIKQLGRTPSKADAAQLAAQRALQGKQKLSEKIKTRQQQLAGLVTKNTALTAKVKDLQKGLAQFKALINTAKLKLNDEATLQAVETVEAKIAEIASKQYAEGAKEAITITANNSIMSSGLSRNGQTFEDFLSSKASGAPKGKAIITHGTAVIGKAVGELKAALKGVDTVAAQLTELNKVAYDKLATRMQATVRGRSARKKFAEIKKQATETKAAITIQSLRRGFKTRLMVKQLRLNAERDAIPAKSAAKVQAQFRRFLEAKNTVKVAAQNALQTTNQLAEKLQGQLSDAFEYLNTALPGMPQDTFNQLDVSAFAKKGVLKLGDEGNFELDVKDVKSGYELALTTLGKLSGALKTQAEFNFAEAKATTEKELVDAIATVGQGLEEAEDFAGLDTSVADVSSTSFDVSGISKDGDDVVADGDESGWESQDDDLNGVVDRYKAHLDAVQQLTFADFDESVESAAEQAQIEASPVKVGGAKEQLEDVPESGTDSADQESSGDDDE